MNRLTYPLPGGELSLSLSREAGNKPKNEARVQDYFSVAARDNPRRAFLFLSKLLGKHLPVCARQMHETYRALATLLERQTADGVSPYLFIGMAETATALSQGVYDAWLRSATVPPPSVFVSTTRYYFARHERIAFEEGHSHAPAIGLHIPDDTVLRRRFLSAKTAVIIDDELSTGKTVVSLVNALLRRGLPIERIITVALTDFSQTHDSAFRHALSPRRLDRVSLLQGQWQYTPNNNLPPTDDGEAMTAQTEKKILLTDTVRLMPRLGTQVTGELSDGVKQQCRALAAGSRRVLILGCGEFMYPPYLLAHYLTTLGIEAHFCATTRSPVKVWGVVTHRYCWADPYGEGIKNYLYNYQRTPYDDVWLVSELPSNAVLRRTAEELNARLLCFTQEAAVEDGFIY